MVTIKLFILAIAALLAGCTIAPNRTPVATHSEHEGMWSARIEQDGKSYDFAGRVSLKKKPFEFVFTGDKNFSYALLSSIECEEIKYLKKEPEIARFIRPTNIVVEEPDRSSKFLFVHSKGAIPSEDNGAQVWSEMPEYEKLSFQKFSVDAKGIATARREIREILFYSNYRSKTKFTLETFRENRICVLASGFPPIGHMTHKSPKYVEILLE